MDKTKDLKNFKNFLTNKQNLLFIIIISIIFCLDRITKIKVITNFNEGVFYINDFLNIDLIWNIGIGFGLLSTDSYFFYNSVTLIIGIVILVLFYILLNSENFDKVIYSMIIGGAIGNFYDRIVYKGVPDFIDLHYNNLHWFVFNLADVFISVGIIILLFSGMIKN